MKILQNLISTKFENPAVFQQDGAPPPYPGMWTDGLEWPACSPDLTPLDFPLGPYRIDLLCYATELSKFVLERCPDTLQNVGNEFENNLFHCQEVQGEHYEHLVSGFFMCKIFFFFSFINGYFQHKSGVINTTEMFSF